MTIDEYIIFLIMIPISLIIGSIITIPLFCIASIYRIYKDYTKYFIYDVETKIISVESMKYFYELGEKCGGKRMEDIPDEFIRLNHSNKKLVYFSFYSGVNESRKKRCNKFIKKYYELLYNNINEDINIEIQL